MDEWSLASQDEDHRSGSSIRGWASEFGETVSVVVLLWELPGFVLFLAWGFGTGNVETGQCDCGPSQSIHPLAGTILEWVGLSLIIPVAALTT